MLPHVILAQFQETARSLEAVLGALCGHLGSYDVGPVTIVPGTRIDRVSAVAICASVAARIEGAGSTGGRNDTLGELVVLVDAINPLGLSAVSDGGWEALIAMLILAFPEVRWVFGVCADVVERDVDQQEPNLRKRWADLYPCHSLSSLLDTVHRAPLFDPTGLREWVRDRTNSALQLMGNDLRLPMRPQLAAAIDEEGPFAYLHAGAAYRFGCRVDVVTSWTFMKRCFGDKHGMDLQPHGYWLLLEDMSLNFHDREGHVSLLDLEKRGKSLGKLNSERNPPESSEHRILVTTGQSRPHDDVLARNRAYLAGKVAGDGKVVLKPSSGMFGLWRKAGLMRGQWSGRRAGNAPGFDWPPGKPGATASETSGHGAPGRLLRVAELLIGRAEKLMGETDSASEAIRGAVLATGERVTRDDLLWDDLNAGATSPLAEAPSGTLQAWLDRATEVRIRAALRAKGGARAEAADELGIERTTLYRLMKRLGIDT